MVKRACDTYSPTNLTCDMLADLKAEHPFWNSVVSIRKTTWHLGLLYKLSKFKFLISLIKCISSFLSQRKCRVSVEGESEISTPRDIQAGVPQGSLLSPTLYITYM
jgi:hypothetical protein